MKTTVDQLARRLRAELGNESVADAGEEAPRIDGIAPALSVSPETAEQVATVVRLCAEANAAMVSCGGGTAMALGNPPRRADVLIQLSKLARVIEHDAANLTVSAQCGITIAALNSVLAAEKQRAFLDPPFPERATLGGTLAANVNGPWRLGYGAVRDLVIGIKAVLANGETIKGGGKVVKNVAGYDMSKLFVGSLGTLGVITEATVRVAPVAESMATLFADGVLPQAEEFVREIMRSALLPSAVFLRGSDSSRPWRVAIRCEGFAIAVERQVRDCEMIGGRAGIPVLLLAPQVAAEFWSGAQNFAFLPDHVTCRVTVPRSKTSAFIRASETWNPAQIVCDAAQGTIWLAFQPARFAAVSFGAMEALARRHSGHAVLFAAPAPIKRGVDVWGSPPPGFAIMRRMKEQFDPAGLMNPGRFIGGL